MKRACAARLRNCAPRASRPSQFAFCSLISIPAHEDRARAILAEELPGVFLTTSSSIAPQFREFERFTTACLSAFIGPKVSRYVGQLGNALQQAGINGELRIMASNGGVATPAMVADKPALTLLSGLAAGVLGGGWVGALCQAREVDHLRYRRN